MDDYRDSIIDRFDLNREEYLSLEIRKKDYTIEEIYPFPFSLFLFIFPTIVFATISYKY